MPEVNYLNADRGIKSWLFTLDHKRIGSCTWCSITDRLPAGRHLRDGWSGSST